MGWTPEIYQARVADGEAKRRHTAGSPSEAEIAAYRSACDGMPAEGAALVLGMTPELRVMAVERFQQVVSVDASRTAIEMFADWIPEELRSRERIVQGNWKDVPVMNLGAVHVIFGDGIIGNLGNFRESIDLLKGLRGLLAPGGRCVMRNVVIPAGIDFGRYGFDRLLGDFRGNLIDESEFGFSARMLGFHGSAYDATREVLDNSVVYGEIDRMRCAGLLDECESEALARYRFMGRNYFPSQSTWLAILKDAGFGPPRSYSAEGKLWESYYPVQAFDPLT